MTDSPYRAAMPDRVEGRTILTKFMDANYPGDAIARCDLIRDAEIGMVLIQWYGDHSLRVGSFTPGYSECRLPGDSPKFVPDRDAWCTDERTASQEFVAHIIAAFRDGWKPVTKG